MPHNYESMQVRGLCVCVCVCAESTAAVSAAAWAANSFFVLPLSPPLLLLLCLRLTFSMLMICKHKHKAQKSKCKRVRERASTHRKYAPYKTDNKRAWGKRHTHTHVAGRHRCDRKQQQRRNQQNFARDLRQ